MGEDAGSISLIALNPKGETGAATTLDVFPYAVGGPERIGLHMVGKDRRVPVAATENEILNCD